ncbi:MAG: DUF433 domain-containing protein [Longimicrobiales bacterium]
MATHQRSIRMPEHLDVLIDRERRGRRGKGWSDQVIELVDESLRMRRCPGIVFREGPAGRRAVVEGTGVDVWAVIGEWQTAGRGWAALVESFPQLTELQLRAALNYYALYPSEVDDRLAAEAECTPERLASEMPFAGGLPG